MDFAGRSIERAAMLAAQDSLRHRGPDSAGIHIDQKPGWAVGLASTRLAIIDPSPGGHQPMITSDGQCALVFNGIIYNYRELGAELRAAGVEFSSQCDSEVVLEACRRWGVDALSRFDGMWALAFVDMNRRCGFLARDSAGIKPLLFAHATDRLFFASEMRALRVFDDWPRDLRSTALIQYLRYGYFPHPETVYKSAYRLSPGTCLKFDESGIHGAQPFTAAATINQPQQDRPIADLTHQVRRTMLHAVSRRRVADVPIGAFLSGGIDSSIIVAHLAELSGDAIQTFATGWTDQHAYDETRYARLVAKRFGTHHHELITSFDEVLDVLPAMLDHLGEPFFDSSILPTALLARFARKHVTVCLSGDGGDELFGGYWRYQAQRFYESYRRWPRWLRTNVIERWSRSASISKSTMIGNRARQFRKLWRADSNDPFIRHLAWSRILAPEAIGIIVDSSQAALNDDWYVRMFGESTCNGHATHANGSDSLNAIMAFDRRYSLPGDMLHKVDLASMRHSLEVRVPFLDADVVKLAASIPSNLKVNEHGGKWILRQAYRGVLPDEILDRPKMGFEVPIGEFLRDQLQPMFNDVVSRSTVESLGILDYDAIRGVYENHCMRRGEHADLLFALLSLCWWRSREKVMT